MWRPQCGERCILSFDNNCRNIYVYLVHLSHFFSGLLFKFLGWIIACIHIHGSFFLLSFFFFAGKCAKGLLLSQDLSSFLLSCLWSLLLQPEHDPPFHVLFHPYWIYSLFTGFTWLFVLPYLEHVQLSQVLLNQAFAFTPWGLNDIISHLQGWGLQFPWIICDTFPQSF